MQTSTDRNTKSASITPWICALIGLGFLLFPGGVVDMLSFLLGGLCIAFGVAKLVGALFSNTPQIWGFGRVGALVGGGILFFLGIYIINHADRVFSLLPIAAGLFFIIDGIERIRASRLMRRMNHTAAYRQSAEQRLGNRRFYTALCIGILTCGIGIFLILFPLGAVEMTLRIIGALILADAIGALWTEQALRSLFRAADPGGARQGSDGKYNAEFRDISDEH